jgi:hypothetical protein
MEIVLSLGLVCVCLLHIGRLTRASVVGDCSPRFSKYSGHLVSWTTALLDQNGKRTPRSMGKMYVYHQLFRRNHVIIFRLRIGHNQLRHHV